MKLQWGQQKGRMRHNKLPDADIIGDNHIFALINLLQWTALCLVSSLLWQGAPQKKLRIFILVPFSLDHEVQKPHPHRHHFKAERRRAHLATLFDFYLCCELVSLGFPSLCRPSPDPSLTPDLVTTRQFRAKLSFPLFVFKAPKPQWMHHPTQSTGNILDQSISSSTCVNHFKARVKNKSLLYFTIYSEEHVYWIDICC